MPSYDFKNLSPLDFEILSRDLLQTHLNITLESFKSGPDQGVDFRYALSKKDSIIVQCKRYGESGFTKLFSDLNGKELEKVKKLKPKRYVLSTSVPLNKNQKDKLKKALAPFVKTTGDIFGASDLNNLLGKYEDIETKTFKLWLPSLPVLEKVMHGGLKTFSRESLRAIKDKAKLFVANKSFDDVLEKLKTGNYCIIAGIPGIGKTILAEMIGLYYRRHGFDFIRITNVAEAFELDTEKRRRFIYFDDFLGVTSFGENSGRNDEQKLIVLINSIKNSKVSKMLMTTREYILAQACQKSEKLDDLRPSLNEYVVDLSKYTRKIRAQILYNHLYFSNLSITYRKALLKHKTYLQIVDHPNYSPRIIEYMTKDERPSEIPPETYATEFIAKLNTPLKIWESAFTKHITPKSRELLLVLLSLPSELCISDLEIAAKRFSGLEGREFHKSLHELDGTFLVSEKKMGQHLIKFHNPSIRDYVKEYAAGELGVLNRILSQAAFWEQISWFWEERDDAVVGKRIRSVIEGNPAKFLDRLFNSYQSPSCALIQVRTYGTKDVKLKRWDPSIPTRLTIVIKAIPELKTDGKQYIDAIVKYVGKEIEAGNIECAELYGLFSTLKESKQLNEEVFKSLLLKTKRFLIEKPYFVQNFDPFCDFIGKFPEFIDEKDFIDARVNLRIAIQNDMSDLSSDPDDYRQLIADIDSVAGKLEIDFTEEVEELEEKAAEIEDEMEDVAHDIRRESQQHPCPQAEDEISNEQIDAMFNSLNEG